MNYEKLPKTISAEELLSTPLPPVKWIIPDLLPAGLALFAGPSKAGKSWLTLWLCLQVAQGKPMWGREIEPHTVLYLSLEDTFNRLQKRLLQLVGSEEAPERLVMQTECSSIGQGLEEQLTSFIYQHPDTGLIVIDTLQKVRSSDQNNSMYASDYKEISALKALADKYNICITVSSKSVDALADLYRFTQDQRDILHQLLSEEMRPSLLALCGGIAVADGALCWPLPGHTYISCHFGEVDAFGNAGHRGTDIPAPEGTPILAAHSGTVLVSGWNDSYGNQVLLDNGAGLSTRYAHMSQTAVTAGEAVTAGQVIGYVGSTGDSTGNHLHFEVMQNGMRMNPLELVFAQ